MQVRALKTFMNRTYGLVRTGMVLTVPPSQFNAWNRVNPGSVEEYTGPREPELNAALPGAPLTKDGGEGNDNPPTNDGTSASSEEVQQGVGRERPSSAARPGRRSRKKT